MDLLTALAIFAIIVGIAVPVLIAVVPPVLEWYYDRSGQPLHACVLRAIGLVNPASEALVRIRVKNRLRTTVPVQVSCTMGPGYQAVFEAPRATLFPSNHPAWTFDLPAHDLAEVELRMKARFAGRTWVAVNVTGVRFHSKWVNLDPVALEASYSISV